MTNNNNEYDYIIIGSGFGGSVSAYRLTQKGYKVLVLEKGRWFTETTLPKSNWDFKNWLWAPSIGFRGIMKTTVFQHAGVMSGVGVGGGSLVYGATLPTPKQKFFTTGSWAMLDDWEKKLAPFYKKALYMLGAQENPELTEADQVIRKLAEQIDKTDEFKPSKVGIFFAEKGKEGELIEDPYFKGEGPARRGCIQCGGCMTGCRYNAKNSLDKNYLHLAQQQGAKIIAETEVVDVKPAGVNDGSEGYLISTTPLNKKQAEAKVFYSKGVIFAGGVMGTIPLLLKLKKSGSLKNLSSMLGRDVRTNNESLTSVTSYNDDVDYAKGVTIGSILNTDENTHLEPISFNPASSAWRLILAPKVAADNFIGRMVQLFQNLYNAPGENLKILFAKNWSKRTIYLLFMQHLDSTLSLQLNRANIVTSKVNDGAAPSSNIPEANYLSDAIEKIMNGKATRAITEVFFGTPSTAHILGGAVMGKDETQGVIDKQHRVFNYKNMMVCDGSAVSANPGVNPSLTITAMTEYAMNQLPNK